MAATDGSITRHIWDLADGGQREDAARELWVRFYDALARHAQRKLRAMHAAHGVADEEDVASRAFTKVCLGIVSGQLHLATRVDLIRVLRSAATREAISQARHGRPGVQDPDDPILARGPAEQMSPELLVLAQDGCRTLLDALGDDLLRQIALWKLVGHTNEEIARKLGCSLAKVERKLGRIRAKWADLTPGLTASSGPREAPGPDDAIAETGGITTILADLAARP